eukprot:235319_1
MSLLHHGRTNEISNSCFCLLFASSIVYALSNENDTTTLRRNLLNNLINHTALSSTSYLHVTIIADYHWEDIIWNLASDSTLNIHDTRNATVEVTNSKCVQFSIYDAFGDGLSYGAGTWFITW